MLKYSITLLIAIKFRLYDHKHIKALSIKFIEEMLGRATVNPDIPNCFILLAEAYSGRELKTSFKNIYRIAPEFGFI